MSTVDEVRVVIRARWKAGIQDIGAGGVTVPPSATVKLSASATGVLSLTGVIVI